VIPPEIGVASTLAQNWGAARRSLIGQSVRMGEKQRWPKFGAPEAVWLIPLIAANAWLLYLRLGPAGLGIGLGVTLLLGGMIAWRLRLQPPGPSGALLSQQGALRAADVCEVPSLSDQASVKPNWADRGYLLGAIHVTAVGLRWEPNARLRRRGAGTVVLPWSQVSSVQLNPLKGVGDGVGADFLLVDGRPLGVWTAHPDALAEALRTIGVSVQVSA
jgi:hypothetical protein